MLKFAQISDTHIGLSNKTYNQAFHLQSGYPDQLPQLFFALEELIQREGIQFILHTGDVVHEYSPEALRQMQELFSIYSVPVYLCLGNHDLSEPKQIVDLKNVWTNSAPELFKGDVDFSLNFDECSIHVLPNQWGADVYRWTDDQTASFTDAQKKLLEQGLSENTDRLHIIATHALATEIDSHQAGEGAHLHVPTQAFVDYFTDIKRRFPHLQAVVFGHTHMNIHTEQDGCHFVGASSFTEAPFDCKVYAIADNKLSMQTIAMGELIDFNWGYNFGATYVQGRGCDRVL